MTNTKCRSERPDPIACSSETADAWHRLSRSDELRRAVAAWVNEGGAGGDVR